MNAPIRKTALTMSAGLALVAVVALSATASQPKALLLAPGHDHCLPTFGFSSFNIHGVGERVTYVRWGGLAAQLGLEPGDMILSMNGYPLTYHGAWNDALRQAVANGGWVQLAIRDVRTGFIAYRETFVGGGGHIVGPITPKWHNGGYHGPVVHHHHHGGHPNQNLNQTIKKIAKLFD